MNPTRPIVTFTALTCATLLLAFTGPLTGGAQETPAASPAPDETPEAATTAIAATPSPTPHLLRPIIFVKPTPWKYGDGSTPTPAPKKKPAVRLSPTPAAARTLSPSSETEPHGTAGSSGTSGAYETATAAPVSSAIPVIEAAPAPSPSGSPRIVPQARRARTQSAAPSPTPVINEAPINDGTAPVYTPPPADSGAPTPIPTQPPTPRPLAPSQPSIPDSEADPNVRGIAERPIRQLSQIGWMQGTWSVTGVTNKADGTTLPLDPTTYVFSPIMRNRWMFGADGKANDYIYFTFDPFARHWVALRFGSNPSYGMWVSEKGWVGNRIDFITNFSYVNGRQYRRRLTIIHKDARTFGIYETEQTPDGSFIPDDAYEFKKLDNPPKP